MSDHSQSESESESRANDTSKAAALDNNVDEETLRIMVSTDNHLGYAERDPIRGDDSFAAFEEVLLLAKRHNCDMVLLAGDLFHQNKPSRLTLHKTMSILRRHTMGPNPVQFQILSDQAQNFRSAISKTVNYEDPYSCVDLPIFSIHGNHDDPTRDGGTEMLAALDLLAVNHLVNYFGRHDEVDKVQVSPVLIKKGDTKVALYGMGSMRDERLNRMWQGKKVRFLRPHPEDKDNDNDNDSNSEDEDSDDGENNGGWFNIFALHQNRDLGRGSKNCVHESMIPEWMDLVVWGHEHECLIDPSESAVGTYRITQPGSSVATSLSEGESMRKHVGILDVRGSQFRMTAVPLMQVRAFATGQISLGESNLDADDPRIDEAMKELLAEEVEKLAEQAREDSRLLQNDAKAVAGASENGTGDNDLTKHLHFHVKEPNQVLVRLKVEHSGFTTLHNQRFGSQFVNHVANPSDILLFHRRRTSDGSKSGKKKKGKSKAEENLSAEPIPPEDLEDINIEDIVRDSLSTSEKKLQILDEQRLCIAVEDFVSKEQNGTIGEIVGKIISGQQKKLVKRGFDLDEENDGDGNIKVSTANAVREACQADTQRTRGEDSFGSEHEDNDEEFSAAASSTRRKSNSKESDDDVEMEPRKAKTAPKKRAGRATTKRRNRDDADVSEEDFLDDEDIEQVRKPKAAPKRRAARTTATKRKRYTVDDSDDEDDFVDDDSDIEIVEKSPSRKPAARSRTVSKRSRTSAKSYTEESDDGVGWGTASTSTSASQRSRRR